MQRSTSNSVNSTALDFLKGRIDYERMASAAYGQRDFRLDRMRELLARLGDPHEALRIVHVAGTKGKGSTSAAIASVLQAAGYLTGFYSSPHLHRVEERLMVGGAICPADVLESLIRRIQPVVLGMDRESGADNSMRPTYFEVLTALAFMRFADCHVDAAVLEVGMGGRLDSTNVCQPVVSVITSISFDHTQHLGATLAQIAAEKAGILKPGVPVVSGVLQDEPRQVIALVAQERGCRLIQLGRDFSIAYRPPTHLELRPAFAHMDFCYETDGLPETLNDVELSLIGDHQAANAALAIAAVRELRLQGWNIPEIAVRRGLAAIEWPARIEVLRRGPTVVLDAAHNVASIEALVRVLDESFSANRRILIFATTRDKDARGMLNVLLPRFDEVIFTRYWNNPRGVPPEELATLASEIAPIRSQLCSHAEDAWQVASERANPSDMICVTGSFFIAAEMRNCVVGQ